LTHSDSKFLTLHPPEIFHVPRNRVATGYPIMGSQQLLPFGYTARSAVWHRFETSHRAGSKRINFLKFTPARYGSAH
jgi:hypothetical protein